MRIPPSLKIIVSLLFFIFSAGSIHAQSRSLEITPDVWIIGSDGLADVTAHVVYPYSDIDLDQISLTLSDTSGNPIESELKFKSMDPNGDLLLRFVPDQTELIPGETLNVHVAFETLSQPIADRPDIAHTTTVSITEVKPPKTIFEKIVDWINKLFGSN